MRAGDEGERSDERVKRFAEAVVAAADDAGIALVAARLDLPELPAIYLSRSAAELFGYESSELSGKQALSLVAEDQVDVMRDLAARRLRGEDVPVRVETAIARRDGKRIPVEVSTSFVELEGKVLSVSFVVDISARQSAEAALARSEERFRRLIESAPEAIWILDEKGIAYANPGAIAMFGYDLLEDVLGADPRAFAHPDDAPAIERRSRAILRSRERLPPHEYRVKRRDGSSFVIEVSSIAIEYRGGPAVLSFARNISERKQIEARLLQADRLATLGMLAGGMAHAINNPLTYVLLDLEQLAALLPELGSEPALTAEAMTRLREAHQGAERIAAVVRRMRTFSRVDDQTRGPVDLKSVLEAAVDMVGNEIRHRGKLAMELGEVPLVFANPARLEQVFLSLLVHAAQSLPESSEASGEVRLSVSHDGLSRVVVEVACPRREPSAAQDVLEEDRARLGVAVSRSIVSSLGGEMRVEEGERETKFRVWLPLAVRTYSEPAPPSSREPSHSSSGVRARLLVIDDDPGVGKALCVMLEDEHSVTSVGSAREALELLAAGEEFDVIFCDLMMPEMGGMALFERLECDYSGLQRKLVFMTGGAFTQDAIAFLARVPNARIEKPFDLRVVRRLVTRAALLRWTE